MNAFHESPVIKALLSLHDKTDTDVKFVMEFESHFDPIANDHGYKIGFWSRGVIGSAYGIYRLYLIKPGERYLGIEYLCLFDRYERDILCVSQLQSQNISKFKSRWFCNTEHRNDWRVSDTGKSIFFWVKKFHPKDLHDSVRDPRQILMMYQYSIEMSTLRVKEQMWNDWEPVRNFRPKYLCDVVQENINRLGG